MRIRRAARNDPLPGLPQTRSEGSGLYIRLYTGGEARMPGWVSLDKGTESWPEVGGRVLISGLPAEPPPHETCKELRGDENVVPDRTHGGHER